jgi:hypothetical protein
VSKKDFELIARILRSAAKEYDPGTVGRTIVDTLAHDLADGLRPTNPRFDKWRFIAACQPHD